MRRLLPFMLAVGVVACQAQPAATPTFVITTTAPSPRGFTTAGQPALTPSPRPTLAPTPSTEPGPPRDDNPPIPPKTPAPVPSPTPAGGNIGGPTPQPAVTPTPGLAIVAAPQAADTWETGPTLRRPRAGLVAALVGGVLVAAEGGPRPSLEILTAGAEAGGWRLNERHDPRLATGTFLTDGVSLMGTGVAANALYAVGGSNGGLTNQILRYGAEGFVDQVASLTKPAKAVAAGQIGETLVVAGGVGPDGLLDSVQRLTISQGKSESGLPMPAATAGSASVPFEGRLWVIGGYRVTRLGELVPTTAVMTYDPAGNAWRASDDGQADPPPALPEARHSGAAAVVDGKLYVVGGAGLGGGLTGTVLVLDRSVQPAFWRPVASLPTPRALLAAAVFGGKIWAIGGRGADGQSTTAVEVYQP